MFTIFKKTFALLLDVASWFLGTLFVGDVLTFVNGADWTTGLTDLVFSTFLVVVFFLVKMIAEAVMDTGEMKKVTKKKALKKAKKKAKKALKTRNVLKKTNSKFIMLLKSKRS